MQVTKEQHVCGQVIGINEYVLMNSISGMLHSVIGCQPLLVLRPTGPITLLIEKLHEASDWLSLPFWPLLAWTGMFVGARLGLVASCSCMAPLAQRAVLNPRSVHVSHRCF